MKTFKEMKAVIDKTEKAGMVSSPKDLEHIPVVDSIETESAVLTLFRNGWCRYRAGKHYTTFSLHELEGYCYHTATGNEVLDPAFFEDTAWYLLPLLLGEDLLQRNQERILSNHGTISYSAVTEDWEVLAAPDRILDDIIRHDELEELLNFLDDRQAYALRSYYCEGLSQEEIGDLLGISQQNVSYLIRSSIRKLQKTHSASESIPYNHRIRNKNISC